MTEESAAISRLYPAIAGGQGRCYLAGNPEAVLSLPWLLLLPGCDQAAWCDRFNLACELGDEVERPVIVDTDQDLWADEQDCAPNDPDVHPSAEEVCDGEDNNCDGTIDEGTLGELTWYLDRDDDLYGTDGTVLENCDQPPGYVSDAGDCDDKNPYVNPQAFEVCGNDQDDNCDGLADGCGLVGNLDSRDMDSLLMGMWSMGQAGEAIRSIPAFDGSDGQELVIGVPRARPSTWDEGLAVVIRHDSDMLRQRGSWALTSATWTLRAGPLLGEFGAAIGGAVDLDGDGHQDLVLGGPGVSEDEAVEGLVYVAPGFEPSAQGEAQSQAWILGAGEGRRLGQALAVGEDLDGEGRTGLLAGMPGADAYNGRVALFLAPVLGRLEPSDAWLQVSTSVEEGALGTALAVADLDGDGIDDLVMASPEEVRGRVRVLFGPPGQGLMDADQADASYVGEADGDRAGARVEIAGDLDDDGRLDLAIGGPGQDHGGTNAGAVWILLGGRDLSPATGYRDLALASARLDGFQPGGAAGTALAGGGEADGDGVDDLLVGAPLANDGDGEVYVVRGGLVASRSLDTVAARILPTTYSGRFGASVAWLRDVDRNLLDEAVVGVPAYSSGVVLIYRPETW